ncbi:MAG: ABC transporter substrate-binding protein, partial [Chloroflexi bacterium]|nr:ABC transporter substrate-binding protein [Chloroflexota bacterium]
GSDKQLMVQLDSLKINYLVINPESIEGILKDIELLGKVTGAGGKARDVVKNMKDRIAQVANKVKGASGVKVFYTFAVTDPNNPWTAGPGSFIDSLITLAGGKNIAAKTVAPYVQFSIEEILRSDPEVIIIGVRHGYLPDTTAEELKKHPVWREISAMKNNQVYNIDGDLVNRSGPRIVQGLEEIASFLYPALFKK